MTVKLHSYGTFHLDVYALHVQLTIRIDQYYHLTNKRSKKLPAFSVVNYDKSSYKREQNTDNDVLRLVMDRVADYPIRYLGTGMLTLSGVISFRIR